VTANHGVTSTRGVEQWLSRAGDRGRRYLWGGELNRRLGDFYSGVVFASSIIALAWRQPLGCLGVRHVDADYLHVVVVAATHEEAGLSLLQGHTNAVVAGGKRARGSGKQDVRRGLPRPGERVQPLEHLIV